MHRSGAQFRLSTRTSLVAALVAAAALVAGLLIMPAAPAYAAAATHLSVSADPSVGAGDMLSLTVKAIDGSGVTDPGYTGTVNVTVTDPRTGETVPQNYTFTSADAGVANLSGILTLAGTRTITATDADVSSITGSTNVNVTPGGAAELAFSTEPSDTFSHHTMDTVAVKILDGYGNKTAGTDRIQLSVNGGTFNGTSTDAVHAVNGEATFGNLEIDTPGTYTLDAVDNTNEGVANATSASFDILAHADIALTMSASPDGSASHPAIAGTDETYILTVTNDGPDMNSSYSVTASIPSGTQLVSAPGCTGTGPITCTGGSLNNGTHDNFTIKLHINSGYAGSDNSESLSFSASVALTDPIQAPDNVVANDTATRTFDVVGRADLSITKTAAAQFGTTHDLAYANSNPSQNRVTFTVTVKNAVTGPSDAQAVTVRDAVPTGTSFVADESSSQCTLNAGVVTCSDTAALAPNASRTYTIVVQVGSTLRGGETNNFTNSAGVSSTTQDINGGSYPKTATSGTIRVHTVPDAPTNADARPGNGNAFYLWRQSLSSNGGETINGFTVSTSPSSPASPITVGTTDQCGTGNSSLFCTNIPQLTNTTPYTLAVTANNAVGSSTPLTATVTPTVDASAQQIKNGSLSQHTGNSTLPSKNDQQISFQDFPSNTTGVGTILENSQGAALFCGGGKCVGKIVQTKLEDPSFSGVYQITLLYDKTLVGGTGQKYTFFYAPNTTDPTGTAVDACPKNITATTHLPCVVVKLGSGGANPALKAIIYTHDIDPTIGGRAYPK